jgi:hypothetical protein
MNWLRKLGAKFFANHGQSSKSQQAWTYAALVYGFNEMAKHQITLGQKMTCRILCENAKELLLATGCCEPEDDGTNPVVLVISGDGNIPQLIFRESDWELMREALRSRDDRGGK